ncbi:ABC transporter ATP-binding protein [Cytobacillus firmus]|uniref:ABC transporter ATP-binding protein n=1 Tax=Cytobacillus firmus TaxID=1399 RepID=UPI00077CD25F|nr:ABC transporter ATP-binding protein [Cytobacillus firmus]MBG9544330.1 ABC transporter [Cytobacillus firmus]MBG9553287.1 ABC transporter [Cytobacillus firmus]MBG9558056.1 ABC transporter [Cytobacillus firmus]MBG9575084.1 ABC transporter [Cytobacillus firmus]MEC1894427.1 ABC transporter ATP-binding protein [Cytobacillus firmus]
MTVLEVRNLQKSFGSIKAVQDISFSVHAGEVFTIIGPNGAGKTTTLEMIEGLVSPDNGVIHFGELDWNKHAVSIKKKIGVQPQSSAMFDLLTPEENLNLFASFYDHARPTEEILEIVNLTEHRKNHVKKLSGGQRQRLAIGLALISDPEIIFLDEPTTGLDPQARRNIWDIILHLKELGKTTILTTHYMEEAEKLSDRVCIVDQGNVITLDSPSALIEKLTDEREIRLSFLDGEKAAEDADGFSKELASVSKTEREGAALKIWASKPEETLLDLFKFTKDKSYGVEQVSIREMSLEDVFIAFTGKEWRD